MLGAAKVAAIQGRTTILYRSGARHSIATWAAAHQSYRGTDLDRTFVPMPTVTGIYA
jgi:hypothetical protein